jgi:hypothetical protein
VAFEGGAMPLIKKSSNSIWRVWSGPWKVGQKDNKKKVGVNVAINIRADKMKDFSEETFVREVSELLIKYAEKHDPA